MELAKTCDHNKEIVESVCNNLRLLYISLRNKPIVSNDLYLILGNLSKALLTLVDDYEQRLVEDEKFKQVLVFKSVSFFNVEPLADVYPIVVYLIVFFEDGAFGC